MPAVLRKYLDLNPPSLLLTATDLLLLFPGVEDVHVGGEGNVLQHDQTVGQRYTSQDQIDGITSGNWRNRLHGYIGYMND